MTSKNMLRLFRYVLLLLLTLFFIVFAVSNREAVQLSLFPFPYTAETPLFVMVLMSFMLGTAVAGTVAALTVFHRRWELANAKRHIAALENEVGGLRAERNVIPALRGDIEPHATALHGALDPRMKRG
jgi:uncharacterized integral membrane protein